MKKRYILLFAGLLAFSAAVSGCGINKDEKKEAQAITATPTPEVTKAAGQLVEMQVTTEEDDIKNVMGEKNAASSRLVIINDTGADIASIYIRTNTDDYNDDTWGTDLVSGKFILKDRDKAAYYYDRGSLVKNSSSDGTQSTSSSYDIRITYTDENLSECYFRKLPLTVITRITLCMDESGDYSVPYAKYLSQTGTNEVSTLSEVRKRLGLSENGNYSYDDEDDESQNTGETDPDDNSDKSDQDGQGENGQQDENGSDDEDGSDGEDGSGGGNGTDGNDMISTAESYIGRPLSDLISACGDPQGQDYQDEPETGKTGYHYYSNFTVSTTVDENGNEIVAGVW